MEVTRTLEGIRQSIPFLAPEILLSTGIIILVILSLFRKTAGSFSLYLTLIISFVSGLILFLSNTPPTRLLGGMIQHDQFAGVLKVIIDLATLFTCLLALRNKALTNKAEFSILVLTVVLGAHFLVMSSHFLIVFFCLEMISIPSYVLAGLGTDKKASEGSLKYFLFGSAASAVMLYGFSILYGITGTLDFTSESFFNAINQANSNVMLTAGLLVLTGLLFKISAAPLHFWTPDVYQGSTMPVIAFFSVVPKIAGFGIISRFVLWVSMFGHSNTDWQFLLAIVAILTIMIGNFGALAQNNVKRLMAYSSIAQSGFLLIGITSFVPQGIHFMVFYACVYTLMNFLVFSYLQYFEERNLANVTDFSGIGKAAPFAIIFLLVGLISLTGLPPTSGFTGKLFIFSGLWESYQLTGKSVLLWLLVFGLVNTVVSLFYYLKIPYYAFLKEGQNTEKQNFLTFENLFGFVLVLTILALFFLPGMLMGWINKVNFVL